MQSDNYLSLLNPEQCQAVMHEGSPLLILAGAGSGKTRVITTKIAWLIEQGTDPRTILAVTFTKKAANEMRERACRLNENAQFAQIRTFHSFGSWFLRVYAEYAGLAPNFTIYDDTDMLTLLSKAAPELTHNQCAHYTHLISRAKDYCLLPDSDLTEIDEDPNFPDYYQKYQDRLHETGNADFGDLIALPVRILKENPEIAEQMHRRFQVIMIDEYQDSNVAQFELLKVLAGPETYVCVVGDDDQSIYSFRGAEVQNILTFQENFKGAELIKLERNYRSVAPVLKIADEVISNNKGRLGKTLKAERGEGKKPVTVFLANQDEETAFCAEMIKAAYRKGCPYSDWAVLYRTNAQSLGFETEFLNRKIPYRVVGSLKFYDREEIKDILAYLALVLNSRDEISFARVVNKPLRGVGNSSQQKIIDFARSTYGTLEMSPEQRPVLRGSILEACADEALPIPAKAKKGVHEFLEIMQNLAAELDKSAENGEPAVSKEIADMAQIAIEEQMLSNAPLEKAKTLASFIEKVISASGLGEYHSAQDEIAGTQRVANMQELANSAALYPKTRAGLALFFDHIELDRAVTQAEDTSDAVTLITLHNTKGLEFPRVIITGIEKGIFPREDKVDSELEEERRLFYVGITRARDELYLTTTASRRLYGRTEWMSPSPFLAEIKRESVEVLGRKPARFSFAGERKLNAGQKVLNGGETPKTDPLFERWKPGTKVYHDDFGYGLVCKASYIEGDLSIYVAFESGAKKQFMPEHCASSLMCVKD